MRNDLGILAIGAILLFQAPRGAEAQAAKPKAEDPDAPPLSDRDRRILDLFIASRKTFTKDGKLQLVYNFETKQSDLVEDWKPALQPQVQRIRWSRQSEGTFTSFEEGIVIGDYGEWIHEAVFLADGLQVVVDQLNVSPFKAGSIQAAVLFNEKKKLSLGVNAGAQAVILKGWKHAKPPLPRNERTVTSNERFKAGYNIRGSTIECILNGRKLSDTSDNVKFTDGFDRGRVGLAWSGSIQCFVFNVSIEGRLDPEWVAKALGESAPEGGKTKKAPATKAAKKASAQAKSPPDSK